MSDLPPEVEALMASLKASITSPAKQEMLTEIAVDAPRLTALALMDPQNAAREMAVMKATLANLAQAEAAMVVKIWTEWASETISGVIKKTIAV